MDASSVRPVIPATQQADDFLLRLQELIDGVEGVLADAELGGQLVRGRFANT